MFSLFRRRLPEPETVRDPLRLPIRDREALLAELLTDDKAPVPVELVDLSVQGVTLRVASQDDPGLEIDDVAQLRIEGAQGDWKIESPVQLYERHVEKAHGDGVRIVRYGLDFVNEGDLLAQIDQAAGRWLNRRRHPRARPELDRIPSIKLGYRHYRSTGTIYDLSVEGLCVVLDAMAAAPFRLGESVELAFSLPSIKKPFEGRGVLRHVRKLRNRAYVGIELDLDRGTGIGRRHGELSAYVDRRLEAMAAFGRAVGSAE